VIVTSHIQISIVVAKILLSCSDDKLNNDQRNCLADTKDHFYGIEWHTEPPHIKLDDLLYHFFPDCNITPSPSQCYPSLAEFAVYMTAMRNDQQNLLDFIEYISEEKPAQVVITALTSLPIAWQEVESLLFLCKAYLTAMNTSRHQEVATAARADLAKLLSERFSQTDPNNEAIFKLMLSNSPQAFSVRNDKSHDDLCARIDTNAWLLLAAFSTSNTDPKSLDSNLMMWGCWLGFAGEDQNVSNRYGTVRRLFTRL